MARKSWRDDARRVEEELQDHVWYRSPLWDKDHLLGQDPVWREDGLAWCGRALEVARDWDSPEVGGLWYTNRASAQCAQCKNRDKEWDARLQVGRR